jgi:hypothetical protein
MSEGDLIDEVLSFGSPSDPVASLAGSLERVTKICDWLFEHTADDRETIGELAQAAVNLAADVHELRQELGGHIDLHNVSLAAQLGSLSRRLSAVEQRQA